MGVSHENCVGDFYGRVVVFGVLLTTTHNETQRDNMNFPSDYTDNIDNWVIRHFYCFKEKWEKRPIMNFESFWMTETHAKWISTMVHAN